MKLAYFMNSYPMTSTTFIRREIEALEATGLDIPRLAVRVWQHPLVDADDLAEKEKTHYLLNRNRLWLILAFARELCINPVGILRCLHCVSVLSWNSGGEIFRPAAYLCQAAYLKQYTARKGIEHLHVHFATNATSVAMLAMQMGGPSYSFTVHGPDELVKPEWLSMRLKIELARFVIAISNYCHARLLEASSPDYAWKIHVVRCGLAFEDFQDPPTPVPDTQVFVCVGRLCPQKAQTVIPAAVAILRDEFPGVKVVLIGDGECRSEIEAAILRYDVADRVEILGWAANTQVREAIGNARALLLPSRAEGVPIVIMEALCLGRPVISTNIAGIPELLDETCGWIVPADDPSALVDAMRQALLCSPQEMTAKGLAGRARVANQNDRRPLADCLRGLFDNLRRVPKLEVRSSSVPPQLKPEADK